MSDQLCCPLGTCQRCDEERRINDDAACRDRRALQAAALVWDERAEENGRPHFWRHMYLSMFIGVIVGMILMQILS